MNCCSERCGHCGRCSDNPRKGHVVRPEGDLDPIPVCDNCGHGCHPYTLSLAGVGIACSRACLDILARQHESAMRKVSA